MTFPCQAFRPATSRERICFARASNSCCFEMGWGGFIRVPFRQQTRLAFRLSIRTVLFNLFVQSFLEYLAQYSTVADTFGHSRREKRKKATLTRPRFGGKRDKTLHYQGKIPSMEPTCRNNTQGAFG